MIVEYFDNHTTNVVGSNMTFYQTKYPQTLSTIRSGFDLYWLHAWHLEKTFDVGVEMAKPSSNSPS